MRDRSPLCVLCKNEDETVDHLWFDCAMIKEVQNEVWRWVGIQQRQGTLAECANWFSAEPPSIQKTTIFQSKLLALSTPSIFLDEDFPLVYKMRSLRLKALVSSVMPSTVAYFTASNC